jgi:glycosyltransferase involved in cell wall biosynthesis
VHKILTRQDGVSNHIFELSQALSKLGINITIIGASRSRLELNVGNLSILGVPNINVRGLGVLQTSYIIYKNLQEMIRRNPMDAIQFHGLTGLVTYFRMRKSPIPMWTKCHGINDPYIANLDLHSNLKIESFIIDSTLSKTATQLNYKLSPHIIANSKNTKQILIDTYNINSQKISVVYNGVNHELFNTKISGNNLRRKLGLETSTVLLFVGDFSLLKGVSYLIFSIKKVAKELPNVSLLLVGGYNKVSRMNVRKLISKLYLTTRVKVIENVPHRELPQYYALADVCIVPSLSESFGNVALEAMACGKPVIASKVGGLTEIINEEVGITVEPGCIKCLTQAILTLSKNEELRQELGRKAANHARKFSWDKTAQETLDVFKKLKSNDV